MTQRNLDPGQYPKALNGLPTLLGTITATTTKDNSNTAVPFTIPAGAQLMVQPDTACYVLFSATAAVATVTSATGIKLAADEKFYCLLGNANQWVNCLAVSGTTVLKVWQVG